MYLWCNNLRKCVQVHGQTFESRRLHMAQMADIEECSESNYLRRINRNEYENASIILKHI